MIEITKDQCTRMLVWDDGYEHEKETRVVIIDTGTEFVCVVGGHEENFYNDAAYETITFDSCEPLPEEKQMTVLDVMWWLSKMESEGKCVVIQNAGSKSIGVFFTRHSLNNKIEDIGNYKFNELIRENRETKLKHPEFLHFTFTNCNMEQK